MVLPTDLDPGRDMLCQCVRGQMGGGLRWRWLHVEHRCQIRHKLWHTLLNGGQSESENDQIVPTVDKSSSLRTFQVVKRESGDDAKIGQRNKRWKVKQAIAFSLCLTLSRSMAPTMASCASPTPSAAWRESLQATPRCRPASEKRRPHLIRRYAFYCPRDREL